MTIIRESIRYVLYGSVLKDARLHV